MVRAMRKGRGLRAVARQFKVDPATVRHWVEQARGQRLERVDFSNRRPGRPRAVNRTTPELEEMILQVRNQLQKHSDLGQCGALAIHATLRQQALAAPPTVRTIGRILVRRGAVERPCRRRRPAPPPGWYLGAVASGSQELDSFDIVEALAIKGGPHLELFNGISLRGALCDTHLVQGGHSARSVLEALLVHWRRWGLPGYAQFDNDTRFQGPHSGVDILSRVVRLCLALEVTPVFAPPRETGFQAAIESYNGLWQAKVWRRFEFDSLAAVCEQSERFVAARRAHLGRRIELAPERRSIDPAWRLDLQRHPPGRVIFLRRTSEQGGVEVLGRRFMVDAHWLHRLVRCEVDLDRDRIEFFALRRSRPSEQPKLKEEAYHVPNKRFHE